MRKRMITLLIIIFALTWLAYDAMKQSETAQAQTQARDTIIERQAAEIQSLQRRIYNLEGTVRDNIKTIEYLLGRPEQPSRGGIERRTFIVTAYTAADWPDNPAYGVTASGHRLTDADAWMVAAADPRYYPPGTRIHVVGIGPVTVLDTGGDVRGPDRLDVFVGMENRAEALAYGRRVVPGAVMR